MRALKTLSAGNRMLLRAADEQELLRGMCRVIVDEGGYCAAAVGYARHDASKTMPMVAYALPNEHHEGEDAFFKTLELTWADTELGNSAMATTIRSGAPCIGRNLLTDPDHAPWREDALRFGYASHTAFPLRVEGEVIGALGIAAAEPDAFDDAEVRLLNELADDLAYGIANLRTRIKHREAEETVRRMAYYDPLTGLANRSLLREQLQVAIANARQRQHPLGLLVLTISHLQEINDTLGYQQGDRLLQAFGERLRLAVSEAETVARVGDTEFAVLLPYGDASHATQTAKRLIAALYEPIEVSGLRLYARGTIGISLFPGHGIDADSLLRRARAAMADAKQGGHAFGVFTASLDQECSSRLAMMGDLRGAIEHNELVLHYQPKVHIASAQICGAEALVRWQHPARGMISPTEFVKLAESSGLITPLTYWVLETAFRQRYIWHEAGVERPLSVNLSAHDLKDRKLIGKIKGLFDTWGAQPDWIQFELTESGLMDDPVGALEMLKHLKQLGVTLSIDDFGTGYSSLSYLQKLPVDTIKIDQSFVRSMVDSTDSAVIVRSTVELGHNLNLEVVAEGVDSQAVWDRLADLGCDVVQGYFVGMPMPAEQFTEWQGSSPWASGMAAPH
ncbi:MAG: EAL domain-containing protein [Proteobacteria bacterium]|nr:EAL domain-containing protein [Pseudomonadota bacterium]